MEKRKKSLFSFVFHSLILHLWRHAPKVLTFGNAKENEVFFCISLTYSTPLALCAQGTHVRKCKRKRGFLLYFTHLFYTFGAMRPRYARSEMQKKTRFSFVFHSLIRTFAPNKKI
ncbi:hypothetical protein CIK88_05065 [Prevotella sp. P5-50]|nr:hypothetical protein CIK88_05065 [Prevotella sp. P5-50]